MIIRVLDGLVNIECISNIAHANARLGDSYALFSSQAAIFAASGEKSALKRRFCIRSPHSAA